MPKPHEVMTDGSGLIRWRPEYDTLRIERRPNGGRRIVVGGFSDNPMSFDLSSDQVEHVIGLLKD